MLSFFKKKKEVIAEVEVIEEDFSDIDSVAKYFHTLTGISFDKQMSILQSKLVSFCKLREIYSFKELLEKIKSNNELQQELIDYLTTNETFFYREIKQVNDLVSLVKASRGRVKILCAPSATGEEPYSIAIALLEAGVLSSNFEIVGIDINSDAIEKAKRAVYGTRNVRNLSVESISKYFRVEGDKYILNNSVKALVSFDIANIFDDSFKNLGKFDFVFSRNMLIYFDKATKLKAKAILESMRSSSENDVFFGHADLF